MLVPALPPVGVRTLSRGVGVRLPSCGWAAAGPARNSAASTANEAAPAWMVRVETLSPCMDDLLDASEVPVGPGAGQKRRAVGESGRRSEERRVGKECR